MNPDSFKREGYYLSWLLDKNKVFFFKPPNKTSATAIKHSAAELARGSSCSRFAQVILDLQRPPHLPRWGDPVWFWKDSSAENKAHACHFKGAWKNIPFRCTQEHQPLSEGTARDSKAILKALNAVKLSLAISATKYMRSHGHLWQKEVSSHQALTPSRPLWAHLPLIICRAGSKLDLAQEPGTHPVIAPWKQSRALGTSGPRKRAAQTQPRPFTGQSQAASPSRVTLPPVLSSSCPLFNSKQACQEPQASVLAFATVTVSGFDVRG